MPPPTLSVYETAVYNLLQAPSSPTALIPTATIDFYINTARQQLAADAECARFPSTLTMIPAAQTYPFGNIVVNPGYAAVVGTPLAVRTAEINGQPLDIRSWEWFANYYLGRGNSGTPVRMAQQGQGSNGTLYFDPTPNASVAVVMDVAWSPAILVFPTDSEGAIPLMWSDAVPFYAAWLACMQLQRQADANAMLARYKELARRGRQETTPSVLPGNLPGDLGTKAAAAKTTLTGAGQT